VFCVLADAELGAREGCHHGDRNGFSAYTHAPFLPFGCPADAVFALTERIKPGLPALNAASFSFVAGMNL